MTTEADRIRKIGANHVDVDIAFFGEIGVVTLTCRVPGNAKTKALRHWPDLG